jgi:hypothetical protein
VGEFKKYLLDDSNGYVQGQLTKEGLAARSILEKMRDQADGQRQRKRERQEK